jgi:hypothetical protein
MGEIIVNNDSPTVDTTDLRSFSSAMREPRRKSVFAEVGLVDEATIRRERCPTPILIPDPSSQRLRPPKTVRFECQHDILGEKEKGRREEDSEWESDSDIEETDWETLEGMNVKGHQTLFANSKLYRLGLFAIALVLMLPILQTNPLFSLGAGAAAIPASIIKREDTNTQICKRWAHQCRCKTRHNNAATNVDSYDRQRYALHIWRSINGRLQPEGQHMEYVLRLSCCMIRWLTHIDNDFLTLDLTKSWQISNPSFTGLPRPDGPPEISMVSTPVLRS